MDLTNPWSVTPTTLTPFASSRAFMVSTSFTDGTFIAKWVTHAGVFGDGRGFTLSQRSKNAMQDLSLSSKNRCTNGVFSPVLGTLDSFTTCTSGSPSTRSEEHTSALQAH